MKTVIFTGLILSVTSAIAQEPQKDLFGASLPSPKSSVSESKKENDASTFNAPQSSLSDRARLGFGVLPSNPNTMTGLGLQPSPASGFATERHVVIQFMSKREVVHESARPDGTTVKASTFMPTMTTATISLDTELDKIELEGDGKRVAIQTITANRHGKLLQALKDAKSETEKEEAAKKLEENYRAHYASETQWRLDRIAELEKRMDEMRAQVKERAAAEEKFLEAAMTLAKLNAQGIAAEPPQLKAASQGYSESIYAPLPSYDPSYDSDQPPSLPPQLQPSSQKPELRQ